MQDSFMGGAPSSAPAQDSWDTPMEDSRNSEADVCLNRADGTTRDPPPNATEAVTAEAIVELLQAKDIMNSYTCKQYRSWVLGKLEEKLGYTSGSLSDHPYRHHIKELLTRAAISQLMATAQQLPSAPPAAQAKPAVEAAKSGVKRKAEAAAAGA